MKKNPHPRVQVSGFREERNKKPRPKNLTLKSLFVIVSRVYKRWPHLFWVAGQCSVCL